MTSAKQLCPKCNKPLPAGSLDGLCAACLMLAGIGSTAEQVFDADPEPIDPTEAQIGRYKLLEKIGEGGFGVVYMAEQLEPVRRRVAVKVIKPGMDSKQIIARFEAERQALAMMDHENIARVLDAGTSENGRPYFVMELVRGLPITDYCDRGKLGPQERLQLMIAVCHAIQHAHQKGVIHRDIKPSNVLVTLYDGRPVPKVIDFGVAKAIQQPLTDKTMFTRFGQVMGTLEYMSPEQAEMSGLDIDTRGDIYSLGVLMYELLTGSTPLQRERLRTAAMDEVLRIIRDEEPERPSLRLDKSGNQKTTISSLRGMPAEKLESLLRGELDWIVMRAIEKDRTRRYDNANDLADDIQRFLDNEPVVAAPPSRLYRMRKFIRKHRVGVGFGSALTAALLAGLISSLWLYSNAQESYELTYRISRKLEQRSEQLSHALHEAEEEHNAKTVALEQKETALQKTSAALQNANGLRLAAESALQLESDPGLALRLAYEALARIPDSSQATTSFINAYENCHEVNTINFEDPIKNIAFVPDRNLAALKVADRLELWDLERGVKKHSFVVPCDLNANRIIPSADGTKIIVLFVGNYIFQNKLGTKLVVTDRAARIFDFQTGRELVVLKDHDDRVVDATFNRDGSRIATASWDGKARLWDAQNGKLLQTFDYDEQQSSLDQGQQEEIAQELVQRKASDLSLAKVRFVNDQQIQIYAHEGVLQSPDTVLGIRKGLEKIASTFSLPDETLSTLSQQPAVDPPLDQFTEYEFVGGGTGSGGWSTSIKPGPQVFDIDTGKFRHTLEFQPPVRPEQKERENVVVVLNGKSMLIEPGSPLDQPIRLAGHRKPIQAFEIDSDGIHVFSADQESIRIWRVEPASFSIELRKKNANALSPISAIDYSSDGKYCATGADDGTVNVWRVSDSQCVASLNHDYDFVPQNFSQLRRRTTFVQFSPDDRRILTHSHDQAILGFDNSNKLAILPTAVVRVWDWERGKLINHWARQKCESHEGDRYYNYDRVAFSQDGLSVVAIDGLNSASFQLTDEGKLTDNKQSDGLPTFDERIQITGPNLALRKWNTGTGETVQEIKSDQLAGKLFLDRHGRYVILKRAGKGRVVDADSGKVVLDLPADHVHNSTTFDFSPDGNKLLLIPRSREFVSIYNLRGNDSSEPLKLTGSVIDILKGESTVSDSCWSSGNSHVALATNSGWVLIWEIGSQSTRTIHAHETQIHKIVFNPPGNRLATASADGRCRIWNVTIGRQVVEFDHNGESVRDVQFSPNGETVLSRTSVARIWPLNPTTVLERPSSLFSGSLPRPLNDQEREKFEIQQPAEQEQ